LEKRGFLSERWRRKEKVDVDQGDARKRRREYARREGDELSGWTDDTSDEGGEIILFSLTEVDLKGQRKRTRLCVAVGG